jgi:hypothetical protein
VIAESDLKEFSLGKIPAHANRITIYPNEASIPAAPGFPSTAGRAYQTGNRLQIGRWDADPWTALHETGHAFGLNDQYKDAYDKRGRLLGYVPNPGYEKRIMGAENGIVGEEEIKLMLGPEIKAFLHSGNQPLEATIGDRYHLR